MDNAMPRGGRMLGNSKFYGNRPHQNEWKFGDSRMQDNSRAFKDSQMQGTSRQHEDFRMQDSRLIHESRMEPNYSPPRMSDVSEMQGNARMPERVRGGSQMVREVRAHPEPRMHSGNRPQGNSRIYEDLPVDDQPPRSRSNVVAYDYNHRRFYDEGPGKDTGGQSNFMNSNENIRSGRSGYHIQDNNNARQGFSDILPGLPNDGFGKKNLDLSSAKGYGPVPGIPPGAGHILTPSLTSSSGPQTSDGIRSTGNRNSYPKEKSSKAFDYLKNWRLKMNMPTDSFSLEKEGVVGNQQQSHDVMPPHPHDDWYTQPPTAEPRVGRASVDSDWNCPDNSFTEKDAYGERSGNKYGEMRYGEPVAVYPRDQIPESDRTGNPPWKWDEEIPGSQNHSAKRNYESMASGQGFNSAHRDRGYVQGEVMQSKRSRLSPSLIRNDRGEALEPYTSVISEQENLSQINVSYSDDAKFKVNPSSGLYESHNDWKNSSFHSRPPVDPSKFARSPHDNRGEGVGSRIKLFPEEIKGMMAREESQTSYSQSRDVRNLSHNPSVIQRSPEPLGRDRYAGPHPHDHTPRLIGRGRSPELNQGPMNQERPPPNEMFISSAPYSQDMSPRLYPRSRSQRSPIKAKSPAPGIRGKSPLPFSQGKPMAMGPRGKYPEPSPRDHSATWRKEKSPGLGRGRFLGPERERSPAPAGRGSPRPSGKGRSPGPGGRGGLSGPSGKQRSPGVQRLSGPPRRERSPEFPRRAKSPGPLGRMRSPGPPRRGRPSGPQARERSPGSPGGGRSVDHGRWKSPGRSLDHSGRGKSPGFYGRERPLESSGRGKSPMLSGKGRSPIPSGGGRSPGPPRRPSSGPLERGRSPGKSHAGRRASQGSVERGKLLPGSLGRVGSPGPGRGRSSGTSGRARSPGLSGRGKQTGASSRGRSPKPPVTGKPSKTIKNRSSGLVPHRSAEYQERPRSRSPVTGLGVQRRSVKDEHLNSPRQPSRGRSPLKTKPLGGLRTDSGSFSHGKQRSLMKDRSPRLTTRPAHSPAKRLAPGAREKNENLFAHEYGEYREKRERSPYLEEISLSPRANRFWSPTRRTFINMRSHHSRERSRSVDALQRACSPVSPQSGGYPGGRNLYPQEPFIPEREDLIQQDRPSHFYRDSSPLSVDGYAPVRKNSAEMEMKGHSGNQRERFYSPSREMTFGAGRRSVEKIHNAKSSWREHDRDGGGQHYDGKKGAGDRISDKKDVKKFTGSKLSELPGGTLSEEEVDDEDLRIHLLRLREQKVEMKLMKLEEESKETELKLLELKKNRTSSRGESPIEEERRYSEKETYPPGRRQESYPRKYQHTSPPERERYHRQHKKY